MRHHFLVESPSFQMANERERAFQKRQTKHLVSSSKKGTVTRKRLATAGISQNASSTRKCRTPHSLFAHHLSSVARRSQFFIRLLLLRCNFLSVFVVELKHLDGRSPIPDALKKTHHSHDTIVTDHRPHQGYCLEIFLTSTELLTACLFTCSSCGHFADTQSLNGYEPNLTKSQNVVAWSEIHHKPFWSASWLWTDYSFFI